MGVMTCPVCGGFRASEAACFRCGSAAVSDREAPPPTTATTLDRVFAAFAITGSVLGVVIGTMLSHAHLDGLYPTVVGVVGGLVGCLLLAVLDVYVLNPACLSWLRRHDHTH